MKKITVLSTLLIVLILMSCKRKSYVCECTDKSSGIKSYGDTFKGELQKKSAQIACDDIANKLDTTSTCVLITK